MSVADAEAELFALFAANVEDNPSTPVDELSDVVSVYRGETRAGQTMGPVAITTFHTGGDATDCTFNLNVYVKPDASVLGAQVIMVRTIDEVNAILRDSAGIGRATWTCGYDQANDVLVASWQINAGRSDF